MTTTPTPSQRLDALCGALDARLRRGPDAEALHPLLDLARIVRDLHRDAQGTPGAPDATPEGDWTNTPISGPETGARRFKAGDRVRMDDGSHSGTVWSLDADGGDGVHVVIDGDGTGVWVPAESLEPLPPVVLPTTPGSVAWTRDGGIWVLTADEDDMPWLDVGVADGRQTYATPAEVLPCGVVRVFDAGTVA